MAFIGMDHGTTGISFCIMGDDAEIRKILKVVRFRLLKNYQKDVIWNL